MLMEPTFEKLNTMKLYGLRDGLSEQMEQASFASLAFEERISMLVDREWTDRETRKLHNRIKAAKLKVQASMEDIDYRSSRGLDASLMRSLSDCRFVSSASSVILTGPTGTGKTYLACALAHQAMRRGHSALYFRAPRLFEQLRISRADGSWSRLLSRLARTEVLVIDDWGLAALSDAERRDFLEVAEDRSGTGSLIMASQLPVSSWHELIGEPTIADAILDRIMQRNHRFTLTGDSLRAQRPKTRKKEINIDPS